MWNLDAKTTKKVKSKTLTGFPVLLIFSVESMHSLQQLPLLAAARVIDKVPGENLFQLADGEVFYRLFIVQIRQRGPDPPLRRRTDLESARETEPWSLHSLKALSVYSNLCSASANAIHYCKVLYLNHVFSGLQVQERRCWSILMLLFE